MVGRKRGKTLRPIQGGLTWSDGIFGGKMKESFGLNLRIAVCAGQPNRKPLVGMIFLSTHPGP